MPHADAGMTVFSLKPSFSASLREGLFRESIKVHISLIPVF